MSFSLRAPAKSHPLQVPQNPGPFLSPLSLFHYHCSTTRWVIGSQTRNWATGWWRTSGDTGGNTEAKNQHPEPPRQARCHRLLQGARMQSLLQAGIRLHLLIWEIGTIATTGWWSLSHTPEMQEAPKTEGFSRISSRAWNSTLTRAGLKLIIQKS